MDMKNNFSTFIELLRYRALHQSDKTAYTFLQDGEKESSCLTYQELDFHARTIAAKLQSLGAIGERALLLYPAGLEVIAAFSGCLYAGVIAVPLPPPDGARLKRTLPRLQSVASDAEASIVLTTSRILSTVEEFRSQFPELQAMRWLVTDEIPAELAENWKDPGMSTDTLAYLQYTSGSTSTPKGVMVSHGNLMHNCEGIKHSGGYTADSISATWMPYFHDYGLVDGLIQPLYAGIPSFVMSPLAFIKRPLRWLQAISHYKVTHTGGPNFAYEYCVKKIKPEQRSTLDLSSCRTASIGAEPIRQETLEAFLEAFTPYGFRRTAIKPAYGLAETTLIVSLTKQETDGPIYCNLLPADQEKNLAVEVALPEQGVQKFVGCGQLVCGMKVVIAHPEKLTQCAADEVGEIWVSGPSVALGYWNRPQATEQTFEAFLADTGSGPFLRTGDLGFLKDGELFVTGRIKDLIIIGGANHYPQDIEVTVEKSYPFIKPTCSAAFSVEVGGEERLVVIAEVDRGFQRQSENLEAAFATIRQAISEYHEIQVYAIALIKSGSIPKTSSGKIQRSACRKEFLEKNLDVVAQWVENSQSKALQQLAEEVESLAERVHSSERARSQKVFQTAEAIQTWLVAQLSGRLKIAAGEIDVREPFSSYGLASREAVSLVGDLEDWLGCQLSASLMYNYPTTEALARHLAEEPTKDVGTATEERQEVRPTREDAVAIVGIGCRFPDASNPETFWQMLLRGQNSIIEVPPERWDISAFYDPNLESPEKMDTRWGGFVPDIDKFDPAFFGLSTREAACMDPQQRLLLEVSWEALENAGIAPDQLAGSQTGVFVGISSCDYYKLMQVLPTRAGTGVANSIAANRLSYFLDLHGPSMAVDTACSSSLVAVHAACQSLRLGESKLALAAGVNVILSPGWTITFSQAGMMAKDGLCKSFDAAADGYVRGEGCGAVVLKRLADAIKDGDNILAIIRGSAVNQDGRSNGLTAPNGLMQQAVIRQALENAGVTPDQIDYVEAHGSGTPLGDVIEVESLAAVLGEGRSAEQRCALGSVKTNVGHLEAAAGMAGLIKAVLSLQNGEIPPHPHLKQINPRISLEETPFVIPTVDNPRLLAREPIFAGVSSFGFGGTNAHIVLEKAFLTARDDSKVERKVHVLSLSAKSERALLELANRYESHLAAHPQESIADLCFTANTGRSHFSARLAIAAESTAQLREQLQAFASGKETAGLPSKTLPSRKQPLIAFLFAGQSSQYAGMARQLYETQPTFCQTIDQCAEILQPLLSKPLLSVLYPNSGDCSLIDETAFAQPALFAVEYALAQMWRSWGIEPDAVMGHSVGEYVAACIAGVFSLEEGLRLIAERGRLMGALPKEGIMAAVFAEEALVANAIAPYWHSVAIAAVNGPKQTVISGSESAVLESLESLEANFIMTRPLNTSHAFHSPLMEPVLDAFEQIASQVRFAAPRIPLISNLTGQMVQPQEVPDATYWRRHIREPVRFYEGMQALAAAGCELFLEIGPTDTLTGMGKRCLPEATWFASLKQGEDDWKVLADSLAAMYVRGFDANWRGFDRDYQRRRVWLPTYPFERKRCWLEPSEIKSYS